MATGVVLNDPLPSGVTFASATSSQGSCVQSGGTVICNLGDLANSAAATATIAATPGTAGVITNTASVRGNEADPDMSNNTATAVTTVSSLPTVNIFAVDPNASEPGTNQGQCIVMRTGSKSGALIVRYTIGGTATSGIDYVSLSGYVIFWPGASYAAIAVRPRDDRLREGSETVTLTLSSNAYYKVGSLRSATVTIADND
jgi:hypothetical protein